MLHLCIKIFILPVFNLFFEHDLNCVIVMCQAEVCNLTHISYFYLEIQLISDIVIIDP